MNNVHVTAHVDFVIFTFNVLPFHCARSHCVVSLCLQCYHQSLKTV